LTGIGPSNVLFERYKNCNEGISKIVEGIVPEKALLLEKSAKLNDIHESNESRIVPEKAL
jgi:hypothetical protein